MEVNINKLDHFGNGIGKINNKVVFVKRSLPGEIIDIIITSEKKNFITGKINKIIKESDSRITSICPYYDKCGGCNFLHTTYNEEVRFKKEKAKELLGMINKFYDTKGLNYRNKVSLHVKDNKIGFYREKTNDIIDINYCYLLNDKLNKVLGLLNNYVKNNIHEINNIVIRTNKKDILLDIHGFVNDSFFDEFSFINTIIYNDEIYKGNGYLEEMIDDYKLVLSPKSFYQVNKQGLEVINEIIKMYLKTKKYRTVLDLYSGISTWGILVSKYVDRVISIEENSSATNDALINQKINNINNLEVINGRVEDYIDNFNDIDLIIIDPPRSGLDKKTQKYLEKINAKSIIYISCDMVTLKRDLDELNNNYQVTGVNLVDMFKRTYHVESIIVLERK